MRTRGALLLLFSASACAEPPPPAVTVPPTDTSAKPAPPAPAPTQAKTPAPGPTVDIPTPDADTLTTGTCDAVCKGEPPPDLASALQLRARQAHRCYDLALAAEPELKGRVVIEMRIAADGSICSAKVKTNDRGFDAVAKCVRAYFGAQPYPPATNGCATVNVPIAFVPKKN